MKVSYDTYSDDKKVFLHKHNDDFTVHTSSMDDYGRYVKSYICRDGAVWTEVCGPYHTAANGQIPGMPELGFFTIEVKLMKVEYWSSDDATSKFYYEKW